MHPRFLVATALLVLGFAVMALTNPEGVPVPESGSEVTEPVKAAPRAVVAPAGSRGQQLYENHCMGCHESVVQIRSARTARSYRDLQQRVAHWASYLKLPWSEEEVADVARYLDAAHYRFEAQP